MDGSLKRNNTMTRKLRAITEAAKDQLLEEIGRLNMLKYLDEAVASIAEGKLKAADLNACVMVCSKLHQRYANFSSLLGPVLAKLATGGPASDTGEPISVQQRKLKLRLLAELVFVSVVDDEKLLVNAVRELSSAADPSSVVEGGGGALAILASFAKNCASDLFSNEVSPLSGEHIATLKRCLESCFESAKQMLHKEHDRLETIERENSHAMDTRGEISSEASAAYERARNSFDSLHRNVSMLAEGLDKEMPQISPDEQVFRPSNMTVFFFFFCFFQTHELIDCFPLIRRTVSRRTVWSRLIAMDLEMLHATSSRCGTMRYLGISMKILFS